MVAAAVNLLVEWLLNHELVTADYMASTTVGVATALAIILLFRHRSGKCCGLAGLRAFKRSLSVKNGEASGFHTARDLMTF